MGKLRCHISISADEFVAGPNQSEENPLGEGGEWLHNWGVSLAAWRELHGKQGGEVNESTRVMEETAENIGAGVMGRNMFGPPGGGNWGDEEWKGWRGGARRTTTTSSSSPIARAIRSRWREGPRSTSSPTGSSARWSGRESSRAARTSGSGAAPR